MSTETIYHLQTDGSLIVNRIDDPYRGYIIQPWQKHLKTEIVRKRNNHKVPAGSLPLLKILDETNGSIDLQKFLNQIPNEIRIAAKKFDYHQMDVLRIYH